MVYRRGQSLIKMNSEKLLARRGRPYLKKRIFFLPVMFLFVIFFSAFTFSDSGLELTRYDLALLFEEVLFVAFEGSSEFSDAKIYSDLNEESYQKIKNVLHFELMKGYSNGEFKPSELISNLEFSNYLCRLSQLLLKKKPKAEITNKLIRILGYEYDAGFALYGKPVSTGFPEEFCNPSDISTKQGALNFFEQLLLSEGNHYVSGLVVDSVSGQPVVHSFIAAGNQAVKADENGRFLLSDLNVNGGKTEIFVVADGYRPFETVKDLSLSRQLKIRLKRTSAI